MLLRDPGCPRVRRHCLDCRANRRGRGDPGPGDHPRLPVRRQLWLAPVGPGEEKFSRDVCSCEEAGSLLRCVHRWLTRTADDAVAKTFIIVAMGRSTCPVRIVGTMNPIQSPQPSVNSALLLTIPNAALRTLNAALLETSLHPSVCLFETRLESHPPHRAPIHHEMNHRVR
jgi:hypothetical protein